MIGDRPHQKDVRRDEVDVKPHALLETGIVGGKITEEGVRLNVSVALQYVESWLRGNGAVGINNLMEDAATAEISRAQLWQWIHHRSPLDGGGNMTPDVYCRIRDEEMARLRAERPGGSAELEKACGLLDDLVLADEFVPFLTIPAYALLA